MASCFITVSIAEKSAMPRQATAKGTGRDCGGREAMACLSSLRRVKSSGQMGARVGRWPLRHGAPFVGPTVWGIGMDVPIVGEKLRRAGMTICGC